MSKRLIIIMALFTLCLITLDLFSVNTVFANQLTDEIDDQLNNVDLSELEKYFNENLTLFR